MIRYSCGILFSCFTFCYLYFLQGEVIAQAQHIHSHGITHYSVLAGAIIITGVLIVLQWVVRMLSRLPERFYALSYLPSALALVAVNSIAESPYGSALKMWAWLVPICVALYVVLCIGARKADKWLYDEEADYKTRIYPNYIILIVLVLGIGSLSSTKDVTYYELKTERLILEGDYDAALAVGDRALVANERLTQLRMYALSVQGCLGDRLFDYPQLYGSQGLITIADTDSVHRVNARDVYTHLGAFCGKNIRTCNRYLQLVVNDDSLVNRRVADYYLCALLLDKHIEDFYAELPRFYNLSDTVPCAYDSLPRSYKEALLMMSDEEHALRGVIAVGGDSVAVLTDTLYAARYREYMAMKIGISNERERTNKTRRAFGNTYWWYYDFSDNE